MNDPSKIAGYVIVTAEGKVKLRNGTYGSASFFLDKSTAQNQCRRDGDSVVPVVVDLTKEPIFIRKKKLNAG